MLRGQSHAATLWSADYENIFQKQYRSLLIRHTGRTEININNSGDTKEVCLEITDRGIGIRKQDLKELFSPFFRIDNEETRREGGTELGLAISKSIVELHGGSISIESKYGKGTSVRVMLPVRRD